MTMTQERKQELIAQARRCMHGQELERYINFVNNYETQSALNDERIAANYPYFFHNS